MTTAKTLQELADAVRAASLGGLPARAHLTDDLGDLAYSGTVAPAVPNAAGRTITAASAASDTRRFTIAEGTHCTVTVSWSTSEVSFEWEIEGFPPSRSVWIEFMNLDSGKTLLAVELGAGTGSITVSEPGFDPTKEEERWGFVID